MYTRGYSRPSRPPTYPLHQHRNMLQQQLRCLICQPATCLYPEQWLSPRCGCRREDRILARDICTRHHVPTRKLSTAQIRADMAGIYSSAPHKSDHDDDPGP